MKINDRRSIVSTFAESEPPRKVTPELVQEIATVSRDITISPYGGILTTSDETLITRGATESYKIYDSIERDCHAGAILDKRKKAVTCREWQVDPADDDPNGEKADFIEIAIGKKLDSFSKKLLDATLKGFAVVEIIWGYVENKIVPINFKGRNQRRFVFGIDGALRLRTYENLLQGVELPESKFIVHRYEDKHDNPYGMGLGNRLFWPCWFKRQGITFWLAFCDKFGSPTVLGKYPSGTSVADRQLLKNACLAISQEAGVIIPEGMLLEYLEAAKTGSINNYETLCRYMDEQMSETVLGETGTTNQSGNGGSRAKDEVGNEVRLEIAKDDADQLSETLNNTLIKWTIDFNFPGSKCPTLWRDFKPKTDRKAEAETDKIVYDMGFEPELESIQEKYGGKWRKRQVSNQVPGFGQSAATPAFSEGASEADLVDQHSKALEKAADPIMTQMIGQIRKLLSGSATIEEFRDKLISLYGKMDTKKLTDLVQRALMTADMSGRNEINNGR